MDLKYSRLWESRDWEVLDFSETREYYTRYKRAFVRGPRTGAFLFSMALFISLYPRQRHTVYTGRKAVRGGVAKIRARSQFVRATVASSDVPSYAKQLSVIVALNDDEDTYRDTVVIIVQRRLLPAAWYGIYFTYVYTHAWFAALHCYSQKRYQTSGDFSINGWKIKVEKKYIK